MVVPATMRPIIILHEALVNKLAPNIRACINGRVVQVARIQWTSELVIVALLLLLPLVLEIRTLMMHVLLLALFPSVTANVVTGLCSHRRKYGIIFELCSSCRGKKIEQGRTFRQQRKGKTWQ